MIYIKQKADLRSAVFCNMVPSARLELAREVPQDSKSCVYTSFTTKALPGAPEGIQTLGLEIRNLTLYSSELQRQMALPTRFELVACRLGGGRSNPTELRERRIILYQKKSFLLTETWKYID